MRKVIFLICVLASRLPVFAQDATPEATMMPSLRPGRVPTAFRGKR